MPLRLCASAPPRRCVSVPLHRYASSAPLLSYQVSWRETPLPLYDSRGKAGPSHGWADPPVPRLGAAVQLGAAPSTVAAAGVVACHSIFTHNCLRVHTPTEHGPSTVLGNDQANDQALVYALLPRRQKINRIAFARKVLTTNL